MPWSAGTFSRTDGTRTGATVWAQAKAALVKIIAVDHDTHDQDLAAGINACLCRDGQNAATANIPMGTHKLTGLSDGANSGDSLHVGQIGEGIELSSGDFRVKLDGTSLLRSASGISINTADPHYFLTGDIKATLRVAADTGWVLMDDGTIGDAASSATTRANADTVDLFTLLWDNVDDAYCAVSGGRGANAAADYAAHKTIAIPKALGRVLGGYGTGSGLTARAIGETLGAEVNTGVPAHTHAFTTAADGAHTHTVTGYATTVTGTSLQSRGDTTSAANTTTSTSATHTHTGTTNSTGSASIGNMQPTLFVNFMIKL